MAQPPKLAVPALAPSGLVVQVSAAPAVPVPDTIDSVIEAPLPVPVVFTLPPASCTCTVGWVGKATFVVLPEGCWVNTSWVAAPTVMLNVLLVAPVKDVPLAASL